MKVVLDANCAIEIALNKKEGERLKALLDESDQVLAPDLLGLRSRVRTEGAA